MHNDTLVAQCLLGLGKTILDQSGNAADVGFRGNNGLQLANADLLGCRLRDNWGIIVNRLGQRLNSLDWGDWSISPIMRRNPVREQIQPIACPSVSPPNTPLMYLGMKWQYCR